MSGRRCQTDRARVRFLRELGLFTQMPGGPVAGGAGPLSMLIQMGSTRLAGDARSALRGLEQLQVALVAFRPQPLDRNKA